MEQNITPNTNTQSLNQTMTTQPSAVISSDLATNVTTKNLQTLAQEEAKMEARKRNAELARKQEELRAEQRKQSEVDQQIQSTIGNTPQVDPAVVERERNIRSIRSTVSNLVDQVDPYTATLLYELERLAQEEI